MNLPRGESHRVAIKVMLPEHSLNETALVLSTREAMTSLRLCHNHPNLVTVFDFDQTRDGRLFSVMEYIDGVALRDIRRQDANDAEGFFALVRSIARATLSALSHLHDSGVIHRDVKPTNILVNRHGIIKLADLGLTKHLDSGRSERFRGTFAYSSPEALKGGAPCVDWDLYSLGVTLYELIAGRLPFGQAVPEAILARSSDDPPPLPEETPQDLTGLIYGLLAHRHQDRAFASADECVRYLTNGGTFATTEEIAAAVERATGRARAPKSVEVSTLPDLTQHRTRSWLGWALASGAAALMFALGLAGGAMLDRPAAPRDTVTERSVSSSSDEIPASRVIDVEEPPDVVCEPRDVVVEPAKPIDNVVANDDKKPRPEPARRRARTSQWEMDPSRGMRAWRSY
jgi:serine/threonine-protein kinase